VVGVALSTAREIHAMVPESPEKAPLNRANDPAKTGYDPSARWTNMWNILTGKMSQEGMEEYREAAYIKNEARDCAKCEEWRDYCFKYSPMVIFMQKNIKDLNGDMNVDNVKCRRCPAKRLEDGTVVRQGGGFSPDHGILICANEMRNRKHLEDTLSHEMVHAWDHLRWKVDWADLRHAACTEVSVLALQLRGENFANIRM
jgi:inner membrane protease ATP23